MAASMPSFPYSRCPVFADRRRFDAPCRRHAECTRAKMGQREWGVATMILSSIGWPLPSLMRSLWSPTLVPREVSSNNGRSGSTANPLTHPAAIVRRPAEDVHYTNGIDALRSALLRCGSYGHHAFLALNIEICPWQAIIVNGALLLDMREPVELEVESKSVPGVVIIPLRELHARLGALLRDREVHSLCH